MAKTKIHVTPDGPKECSASIKTCTYAQNGGEHYDNMDDAQAAYDKQMKEEHGSFATKKTAAKPDLLNIDNKDVTEFINSRSHLYDRSETLYGKTFKEVKDNINSDYEKYKNSDRSTNEEFIEEFNKSNEVNDDIKIIKSLYDDEGDRQNTSTYVATMDYRNKQLILNNYNFNTQEGAQKDFEESVPPLKSDRKLINSVLLVDNDDAYEEDYYYNDYDDEGNLIYGNEKTYYYELSDSEVEKFNNQRKFEAVSEYKQILDDPSQPDWNVLGKNQYVRSERPFSSNKLGKNPTYQNTKLLGEKSSLESKISELENNKKIIEKTKPLYENAKKEVEKVKKEKDYEKDPAKQKELAKLELEKRKEYGKYVKIVRKAEDTEPDKNIAKYKEELDNIDNVIKGNNDLITENNRLTFEDNIAAGYPSYNHDERRKAAQQWMKENEKHLPKFDAGISEID